MPFTHRVAIPCRGPSEREQLPPVKPEERPPSVYSLPTTLSCCFLTVTQNSMFLVFRFGSTKNSLQRTIAIPQTTMWCKDPSKLEMRKPV